MHPGYPPICVRTAGIATTRASEGCRFQWLETGPATPARLERSNATGRCHAGVAPICLSRARRRGKIQTGAQRSWAQKRREALIRELEIRARQSSEGGRSDTPDASDTPSREKQESVSPSPASPSPSPAQVPISAFKTYLELYQQALYPVWPVIDKDVLLARLQDPFDIEAYALAAALSAVTIAQLKLPAQGDLQPFADDDGAFLAAESSRARFEMDYLEHPSISIVLTSFFLHVSSANRGQIRKGAMLLREAVACAQLLRLDKTSYYENLSKSEQQKHLRVIWLLFVTER